MNNLHKIKIAICISGYIRTFQECFLKNIENIKKSNPNCEIEVYFAFWDSTFGRIDKINDPWHSKSSLETIDPPKIKDIQDLVLESKIEFYKIAILDLETNEKLCKIGSLFNLKPPGLLSQYFSTQTVYEIAQKSNADFYLRLRPDVILEDFPVLSKPIEDYIILNDYYWYNSLAKTFHENEMFWVSTKNYAKKSFSQYQEIINNNVKFPNGLNYGELITGCYFQQNLPNIKRHNFKYKVIR